MIESSRLHPALKRALAATAPRVTDKMKLRSLGVEAVDRVLSGGLATDALHELFAREGAASASAMGFAVMLAVRLAPDRPLLWLREEKAQRRGGLNGPGLVDLGMDPARLILGILPDAKAVLRAGVDALRTGTGESGLGAVILELHGNPAFLDLTASRRLALAAETSGAPLLMLRLEGAKPAPSAARTRWNVGPAPSGLLAADAPGLPALAVTLLRQRGGPAGLNWILEWDRDAGLFRPAALPGACLSLPGRGSDVAAGEDERWRLAS